MKALFVLFISFFVTFDSMNVLQLIEDRLKEIEEEKQILKEMEVFNEMSYGPFSERMERYSDIVEQLLKFEERTKEKVCLMVDDEDHNGALFERQELLWLAMADRFFLPENDCSIVIISSHGRVKASEEGITGTWSSFLDRFDYEIKSIFPEIHWGFSGCRWFPASGCEYDSCYQKSNPVKNRKARWDGDSFYYTEDGDYSYTVNIEDKTNIDHLFK